MDSKKAHKEELARRDRLLIERCLQGDQGAYMAIYNAYAPIVLRHLRVLLGSEADAEDALQRVFEIAFERLQTFEFRSTLATWLRGIGLRVASNQRRSRSARERRINLSSEAQRRAVGTDPSAEDQAVSRQLAEKLEQRLERVPEKRRTAFLLYYVEQLSLDEVSDVMGSKKSTTWARIQKTQADLWQALRRLRPTLTAMKTPSEEGEA